MSEEQPSPPMKPQDTVIFLLGELKGGVSSLKESVDSTAASQAQINLTNEQEHAKFRETLGAHDTAIAVLNDGKRAQQENTLTNLQRIGLWVSVPSGLGALVGLVALWISSK